MPGRAMVLMISTLALGPGLIVNVILKDNWGRPRPQFLTEFGGPAPLLPWWDPRGKCDKNCSFVAGEPSGAFWTMSAAAVAPPQWRAAAYAAAITFGSAVGVLRMSAGGHFFTDVVFSGVVVFLLIWLVHGLLYRWRPTRLSDADVERSIERLAMPGYDALLRPGYDAVMRLAARLRGTAPRS
jgi:membrane-associated phospholipid phosphatase